MANAVRIKIGIKMSRKLEILITLLGKILKLILKSLRLENIVQD